MAFNFATLPKVRAYGYMGGLGAGECTWYTPWNCVGQIDYAQASTELANAQTAANNLAAQTQALLQDIQTWPDGYDKSYALPIAQANYTRARELVTLMVQMTNDYNVKAGVAGLRGLGVLPPFVVNVLYIAIPTVISLITLKLLIGNITDVFTSKYQAAAAPSEALKQFYISCADIVKAGGTCDPNQRPDLPDSGSGFDLPLSVAALGGLALIVLLVMVQVKSR